MHIQLCVETFCYKRFVETKRISHTDDFTITVNISSTTLSRRLNDESEFKNYREYYLRTIESNRIYFTGRTGLLFFYTLVAGNVYHTQNETSGIPIKYV